MLHACQSAGTVEPEVQNVERFPPSLLRRVPFAAQRYSLKACLRSSE